VTADYAAQRASVAAALRTHPERMALNTPVARFDAAGYRRDPSVYLNVIEPGRVLAPAAAGPDVPVLRIVGADGRTLAPLGTTTLSVRAAPRAPVSFTSLDKGLFANDCNAITVQADDTGLATVSFTADVGTTGTVNVLSASPLASSSAHFILDVISP
jgi:hypothetical protein